jgi:hypothetical protein
LREFEAKSFVVDKDISLLVPQAAMPTIKRAKAIFLMGHIGHVNQFDSNPPTISFNF